MQHSIARSGLACLLSLTCSIALFAQTNVAFVGQLSYQELRGSDLSNLWGYTDEFGNEYALMGVNGPDNGSGGLSVVDLSDPADPQEIFFTPGPRSIWREVKVWQDHAYITTEANNGGLMIVDLSPLPESTDLPVTVYMDPNWSTSHSLFIDEHGRLYIFGASSGNGGTIMYDLTQDPMAPVEVGQYDPSYIHDGFARGDTLYAAHIINGYFTIVDVSDPQDPIVLGQHSTPNFFTHNVWLDASGDHLFTTDERWNAYVASYDISDPTDIQYLGRLQSDPGSNSIPHNTYWLPSGHLVQSYYTYGVTIYDASRPHNLVEVGHYDTSPLSGGGFFGAWGVYPFFDSGRLIISDIEEGLFILDPTYVRACWLEGSVTDAIAAIPVSQATLMIVGTNTATTSAFDGTYGTGYVTGGTYSVTVSAPGYYPTTIAGVVLENGVVTMLNVQLDPLPAYTVSGVVRTTGTGEGIEGAQVWLKNGLYTFQTLSNADGSYEFPEVYAGWNTVDVGAWGRDGVCPPDLNVPDGDVVEWNIDLAAGYADDFALDLGWQEASTASRGRWALGDPAGTSANGVEINPESDVPNDCRDNAYVTGNSGGSPSSDDVDEGGTLITSPVFDATGLEDPHVRYQYWFYNSGGNGPVDDALVISLTDGVDTVVIQTVTAPGGVNVSAWRPSNIRIADHIIPSSTMRLLVYTSDEEPTGHLVEAGFDDFRIAPNATANVASELGLPDFLIYPNPASTYFTVQVTSGQEAAVEVLDAAGRSVLTAVRTQGGRVDLDGELSSGTYLVRVRDGEGRTATQRLTVLH